VFGLFPDGVLPFMVLVVDGGVRTGHLEKVDGGPGRIVALNHFWLTQVPSVVSIEYPAERDVRSWFGPNSKMIGLETLVRLEESC
jgi:hypothetical protein